MSLDVYLKVDTSTFPIAADLLDGNGFPDAAKHLREAESHELWSGNITHNLNRMAEAVGFYGPIWRPEENNIRYARDLIPILETGLRELESSPAKYREYDSKNGWGTYDHFVLFVRDYLNACREYPDAVVSAWR